MSTREFTIKRFLVAVMFLVVISMQLHRLFGVLYEDALTFASFPKQPLWGIEYQLTANEIPLTDRLANTSHYIAQYLQLDTLTLPQPVIDHFMDVYGKVHSVLFSSKYFQAAIGYVYVHNGFCYGMELAEKTDSDVVAQNALSTVSLNQNLRQMGIPFLAVVNPCKELQTQNPLPEFAKNRNLATDQFLEKLRQNHVDFLDNREIFLDNPEKHYNLFYRTDHHWKTEYAFYAFVNIAQKLKRDYSIDIDENLLKADSYDIITDEYPRSQQETLRRMGSWVVPPEKERSYYVLKGKNRNVVVNDYYCFPDKLYADCIYETIDRVRYIRNPQNPNGPKILIIKDSFVEFLYQFFVPACSEVELIDCRNYEGKILDYIQKDQPDLVLLMYNTSMFLRPYMFRFDAPLPPGADYR